jgi:hypothetical protein
MSTVAVGLEVALLALQMLNTARRQIDPGGSDPVIGGIFSRAASGEIDIKTAEDELSAHVKAKGAAIMDGWNAGEPGLAG